MSSFLWWFVGINANETCITKGLNIGSLHVNEIGVEWSGQYTKPHDLLLRSIIALRLRRWKKGRGRHSGWGRVGEMVCCMSLIVFINNCQVLSYIKVIPIFWKPPSRPHRCFYLLCFVFRMFSAIFGKVKSLLEVVFASLWWYVRMYVQKVDKMEGGGHSVPKPLTSKALLYLTNPSQSWWRRWWMPFCLLSWFGHLVFLLI